MAAWQYAQLWGEHKPGYTVWEWYWIRPDGTKKKCKSGELEEMNRAGADGWELILFERGQDVHDYFRKYTFKRPVAQQERTRR